MNFNVLLIEECLCSKFSVEHSIHYLYLCYVCTHCTPADTAPHHTTEHVSALRAAAGWAGRPRAAGQCWLAQLPAGEHAGVPGPAPGLARGHPGARLAQRHLRQERTRAGRSQSIISDKPGK